MSEAVPPDILVGIDTHKHVHAAVAITALGADRRCDDQLNLGRRHLSQ